MSQDDSLEEQIRQFYENVPEVHDALPMKDYLLKHENNQMAWYLLGKQYAARGEHGKANYCFAQAGPVYEAFESRTSPVLAGPGGTAARPGRRRARRWAGAAAALLALALGLLLPGGQAQAPGPAEPSAAPQGEGGTAAGAPAAGSSAAPADATAAAGSGVTPAAKPGAAPGKANAPTSAARLAYVAGAADPNKDGPAALGRLLTETAAPAASLLVQTPTLDGKWTDWLRGGKPLASITAAQNGQATAAVSWFDAGWCPCQGGQDPGAARRKVAAWKPLQEAKLVLRSAIERYRERTGKWPASSDQLAAAYPNNEMAGWSEEMTPWFEEIRAELTKVDGILPDAAAWPEESGEEAGLGKPAGSLQPLAEKPLEVIIDKSNHRLAVVSGSVLLRNYEVGLGGDRTPEGSFVITEKVRNPNGRSDGEFGSRGMTLSDTLYAIHGTDEPDSLGKDESHGCVRMAKEDLEELYDLVSLGTPVRIVKEGLPRELRTPEERFRLTPEQDETNPQKQYHWLR
ncbi:L,D-transpeptidase [Cohnella zeiphila]|uniref:L,D-transpeptidase n=1 Tax=Cohnella zeiphila TaxID=2761120 RepID=A0A7X0SG86_9BACL|nr:L,D-transpeptidase [Cohnella zeiphila]MBB6729402.1 L,D-transpeptidase [Cohnella zeiphila]